MMNEAPEDLEKANAFSLPNNAGSAIALAIAMSATSARLAGFAPVEFTFIGGSDCQAFIGKLEICSKLLHRSILIADGSPSLAGYVQASAQHSA